jgi:flagellar biosynthesis protein FlhG
MSLDQAAGLRRMLGRPAVRVLPLASSMDGAAQAALALRLAGALLQLGNRVVVLDASRGEVAAALGLAARRDLLELLQGEKEFADVALAGPEGLRVVPAARGIDLLEQAGAARYHDLFGAFAALSEPADLVLLNCAPGDVHPACRAASGGREVVLALQTDAESVTDAYALIKTALRRDGQHSFRMLFSGASPLEAGPLLGRMSAAALRFLEVELRSGGVIPRTGAGAACRAVANASYGWNLPVFAGPGPVGAPAHTEPAAGSAPRARIA